MHKRREPNAFRYSRFIPADGSFRLLLRYCALRSRPTPAGLPGWGPRSRGTAPIRVLARKALSFLMVARQLKGPIEQAAHINLFSDDLTGRRRLTFLNKITTTKLVRRKTQ